MNVSDNIHLQNMIVLFVATGEAGLTSANAACGENVACFQTYLATGDVSFASETKQEQDTNLASNAVLGK